MSDIPAQHDTSPSNHTINSMPEPAETPAGLGRDAKYCPLCPGWYRLTDINAIAQDSSVLSADKVLLSVSPNHTHRKIFRSNRSHTPLTRAQRADIVARNYRLQCPRKHNLTNSIEPTDVVGIIGNVNSSKSHYLTGLIYEIVHEQRLFPLGADVAYMGDSGQIMDDRIKSVYREGVILPNTEPGNIDGPFSYKLTRNVRMADESKSVLTFFDVAGEECIGLARSADFVRYLFDATGVILLIDPGGLPIPGRPLEQRGDVELATRGVIDNLADAMEQVIGISSRDQNHIISIAISKADIADLPVEIWPPNLWVELPDKPLSGADIRTKLKLYSQQCRQALYHLGGQAIIGAAEARFNSSNVFYSAVSATNQSPLDGHWCGPYPAGCTIPLAQVLWFSSVE